MRFLLDQNVYSKTAEYLRNLDHQVVTATEIGFARASDIALLDVARNERRVLVTRDRDFGALIFVRDLGAGVIYLRITPSTIEAVHAEFARVLSQHSEQELSNAFVVIEPGRHRFRTLPR